MQLRSWFMVSLVLNAGLLCLLGWTWRAAGDAKTGEQTDDRRRAADAVVEANTPKNQPTPREPTSLIEMRDALRAAGVAPDQIMQVLSGMLSQQHSRAKRASSWWKGTPFGGNLQFADPMEMHREQAELRRLMDEPALLATARRELDLSYLPEGKREAVARVLSDYAEVKLRHAASGLHFSADQAREELLRAELQRDLRAVLTEAEYLEHTLRDMGSAEWTRLRMDAAAMNLTEQEFRETARALLAARSLVDEGARLKAVEQVHAELRARVGEERIWEASAKNSHEFYQLRSAQVRFGFSQDAADRVVTAWRRAYEAAEGVRAETDGTKRAAAWRALAADTRKDVVVALGEQASQAYLEQSMHWLNDWERGEDTRWSGFMKKQP